MSEQTSYSTEVKKYLKERYFPYVGNNLNQTGWNDQQHEANRLSRSLAGLAIEINTGISTEAACNQITDGEDDGGIDSIFYDRTNNQLLVVQAKIKNAAPNQAETLKSINGVRILLRQDFHLLNASVQSFQQDILEAMDAFGMKIMLCLIHLGGEIDRHAKNDLDALKTELNKDQEVFNYENISLETIYSYIKSPHKRVPIDLQLPIEEHQIIPSHAKTFIGVISASEIATLYEQFKNQLFQNNIRDFIGVSGINPDIQKTLHESPENLFYLNNGITAICKNFNINTAKTRLDIHQISIVNGAQTVGTIGRYKLDGNSIHESAKLHLTLIQVEDQSDFADQITRARNTQNSIQRKDFAALDPNQERLRQELAVAGFVYFYRRSNEIIEGNDFHIKIDEASIAIACTQGNVENSVKALRDKSAFTDISDPVYRGLFNNTLSGIELARRTSVFRYIINILENQDLAADTQRRRLFFRHGKYFICIMYMRHHQNIIISQKEIQLTDEEKVNISRELLEFAELIYTVAEEKFQAQIGYLAIFRKLENVRPLGQNVQREIDGSSGN